MIYINISENEIGIKKENPREQEVKEAMRYFIDKKKENVQLIRAQQLEAGFKENPEIIAVHKITGSGGRVYWIQTNENGEYERKAESFEKLMEEICN